MFNRTLKLSWLVGLVPPGSLQGIDLHTPFHLDIECQAAVWGRCRWRRGVLGSRFPETTADNRNGECNADCRLGHIALHRALHPSPVASIPKRKLAIYPPKLLRARCAWTNSLLPVEWLSVTQPTKTTWKRQL